MRPRSWIAIALVGSALGGLAVARRDELFEKRVRVIESGSLVRGAWQKPGPLRRLVEREKIATVVSLSAINRDDPKYVDQEGVLRPSGVRWLILPWKGSKATPEQMAEAADLLADPALRPVFFHCIAGHHRTGLALAAYRIRHQGWSADRAWAEWLEQPWARPTLDGEDRREIEAFAGRQGTIGRGGAKEAVDAIERVPAGGDRGGRPGPGPDRARPLAVGIR